MKIAAYIFARSGSVGLPRKNLLEINGKPLVVHAIECAKKSKVGDNIYVSTDSIEIATVAEYAGAKAIIRPAELATNEAPEFLAWKHALSVTDCDIFVSTPCTCPLRMPEDIDRTIDALTDYDVAMTVTPLVLHPFGLPSLRRQDKKPLINIVGSVYVAKANYIRAHDNLWEGSATSVEIPPERSIDIDTAWDFKLAKLVMEHG